MPFFFQLILIFFTEKDFDAQDEYFTFMGSFRTKVINLLTEIASKQVYSVQLFVTVSPSVD